MPGLYVERDRERLVAIKYMLVAVVGLGRGIRAVTVGWIRLPAQRR